MYYISKTLVYSETRYFPLENMVPWCMPQESYPITFTERIAKWGTRLGSFDVRYRPRNAIKGQVLVDFIVEFTPLVGDEHRVYQVTVRPSKVYVDGASNACEARIGIMLESLKCIKLERWLRLGFPTSNNEAKYKALVPELRVAMKLGVMELEVYSDSQLVVSQVEGIFEARDPRMAKYLKLVLSLQASFGFMKVSLISRGSNSHADSLATLASSVGDCIPQIILVESLEL